MDFERHGLKISVTEDDRPVVNVQVESGSALLGSGGHCDVRLTPDRFAVEQLWLEAQPGGLFAEARSASPMVLLNGVPFHRGRVLAGQVFEIGPVNVLAELVEVKGKKYGAEPLIRPRVWLLICLVLPLTFGLLIYGVNRGEAISERYKEAPPLFDPKPPACAETSAVAARAAVQSWLRDAYGRHERAPFNAEDGVQAVHLYRRAASCLLQFGSAGEAQGVNAAAATLMQRLERDFHVHRLRLYRALEDKDMPVSVYEVRQLRLHLTDRQSEFAAWLDYLERRLSLTKAED